MIWTSRYFGLWYHSVPIYVFVLFQFIIQLVKPFESLKMKRELLHSWALDIGQLDLIPLIGMIECQLVPIASADEGKGPINERQGAPPVHYSPKLSIADNLIVDCR